MAFTRLGLYGGPRGILSVSAAAPILTSPTAVSVATTSMTPRVTTDTDNGTLYMVVVPDGDAPSVAQIKAGQQSSGAAAIADDSDSISVTGAHVFANVVSLSAGTEYELYFVHTNSLAVDSASATIGFATSTAIPSATDGITRPIVPHTSGDEVEHRRQLAIRANASFPKDGTEGMTAPLSLKLYDVADEPDATLWSGSVIYSEDTDVLRVSDGTAWSDVGGGGAEVNDLTAAVTWTNIPIANVPTGTSGSTVALGDHTQILASGATDVTATAAEVNLLDLSGLTAGWVLSADTATTASWKAQAGGGGSATPLDVIGDINTAAIPVAEAYTAALRFMDNAEAVVVGSIGYNATTPFDRLNIQNRYSSGLIDFYCQESYVAAGAPSHTFPTNQIITTHTTTAAPSSGNQVGHRFRWQNRSGLDYFMIHGNQANENIEFDNYVDGSKFDFFGEDGIRRFLLELDPSGSSYLHYAPDIHQVMRSVARTSGGIEVYNTATGSTWERVLTESDGAGGAGTTTWSTGGGSTFETGSTSTYEAGAILEIEETATMANPAAGFGRFWVRDDVPNVPMFTNDAGTDLPLGLNVLPTFNMNATDTLEANHNGHITGKDNTTSYTLTGPTSGDEDFPVEGVAQVVNLGSSVVYTISDTATCTMYWMDGTAAPVDIAGSGTLAAGGWISLWRYSTTAIYITGHGFTP